MDSKPTLYSYYRSTCSWRVRISLAIKNIQYNYEAINLLTAENRQETYLKINPLGFVPTLKIDGFQFSESVAILEYLEETRPEVPLLPKDPVSRAKVRQLVQAVASDTQPLQNSGVLASFPTQQEKTEWAKKWITKNFVAIEKLLEQYMGQYSVGDTITLADVCLVPQIYNARRFEVDLVPFPRIVALDAKLADHPAFKAAHPSVQPDFPPTPAKN